MAKITQEIWLGWIGALIVATAITITFAYGNFETKEHAKETRDHLAVQLERIENKLDQSLLQRR